jgi:transposase InsO family protein
LETGQAFTSPAHPQSSGKLERFHRTIKSEHVRRAAYPGREDAAERMKQRIRYYNGGRLHSALYYLPPDDVCAGRMEIRLAERKKKLHTAYINRQSCWQAQAAKL